MRKAMGFQVLAGAAALLAGCGGNIETVSTDFNSLPLAVQKTVRAQGPDAEIVKVQRASRKGVDVYEVTLRKAGQAPTIIVAPDGRLMSTETVTRASTVERLLTPTGTGTPISALPLDVQRTVRRRALDRQVSDVTRTENNGVVIYEIEFAGNRASKLRVRDDGELVR